VSDDATTRELQQKIRRLEERATRIVYGAVTDTSPLTITLGGSAREIANVRCIDGLSLSVGDTVAVAKTGSDLLVLGSPGTPL